MNIEKYNHHGKDVFVRSDLKGKHRDNCLCFICEKFKPLKFNNCHIAEELFKNCKKFNVVTPVWECPEFNESEKVL